MRASGVLLPVSSLPSKYGIGCFSKEALKFIDGLVCAGQSKWQVLPLGPTGYGDSPYQSFSTFAGNPYFIDLETLIKDGLLEKEECENYNWGDNARYVDYGAIYNARYLVLRKAFARFEKNEEFEEFCEREQSWLEDYCLFMAIKNSQKGVIWTKWEKELRTRDAKALEEKKAELREEIQFYSFIQYEFDKQWKSVKKYANENGVQIIGDLPIYVALDSADAWANPSLFQMDENCLPKAVAGCPPDAFSKTGQLWGNPLYDWDYHKETGYAWWIRRMARSFELYDIVRVDHFRAFSDYYSIPADEDTAMNGTWMPGPGYDLFEKIEAALGEIDVIAEDLGTLDQRVFDLMDATGYPGMKVLQFAFDSNSDSIYLPHNHKKNCVVYTGTHDNMTTRAWYYELPEWVRNYTKAYLNNFESRWERISWDFIRCALSSVADLAIIPMGDLLCAGKEGRINFPSTAKDNWRWRMLKDEFSEDVIQRLHWLTEVFYRLPKKAVEETCEKELEATEAIAEELEVTEFVETVEKIETVEEIERI